ncbi:MAG TPA: hypothetical protein VFA10_27150 [Ktedonobacteraceae bacterium]|nr:hypothetical protein [Ktedonobacteraceae bacterium]
MATDNDAQKDSRIVYVDELAGEDDYWLSITDAARVTRRQEVSVRRWIAKGDLPVRRRSVGLNRRTRQVRASDLKKLTEIIDPTAAITSDEGRLDLVSIPRQQQVILDEYKQVTARMQFLSEQFERSSTTLQQAITQQREDTMRAAIELRTTLTTIRTQQQEALSTLLGQIETARTQQAEQLSQYFNQELETVKTQQEQQAEVLSQQLAGQQETVKMHQAELLAQHRQHREDIERTFSSLTPLFEAHAAALDRASKELQASFEEQRTTLQALEQQLSASSTELAQQMRTLLDSLTSQLNAITERQHSYGKAAQMQADTLMGHLVTLAEQQDAGRNALQTDLGALRRALEAQALTLSQLTERMQQATSSTQGQQSLFPDESLQAKEQRSKRTKQRE